MTAVGCPTRSPLSVVEYNEAHDADPVCFLGDDVAIYGYAGTYPVGIGWLPPGIEPAWLALSTAAISSAKCKGSTVMCGDWRVAVHIPPGAGIEWKQDGRWVVVTGHTRDPRAESCKPDQIGEGAISLEEARQHCRDAFVLTSVRNATTALRANSFARVLIPELNVRLRPSTSAPIAEEGHTDDAPTKLKYGTASGVDSVYILDGPVRADGFRWWRVSRTEYVVGTLPSGKPDLRPAPLYDDAYAGWVADGEGKDAWLLPENPCPRSPVDTAAVTAKVASWAIGLGCFGGQTLTFRGWSDGHNAIFPTQRAWDEKDIDRLDFRLDPATLQLPAPGQWLELTGQFDHPSAASCVDGWPRMECRTLFTVTKVVALGP